jgi:DNA-binding GntR family transcriptional regulator
VYDPRRIAEVWHKKGEFLHQLIIQTSGNVYIARINESLSQQFSRFVRVSRRTRRNEKALYEHLDIVSALCEEDKAAAMEAMRRHIRTTTHDILTHDFGR